MSVPGVSFQGNVPQKEKRKNTINALAFAPLFVAGDIALEAMDKSNRKDSFVKTAKVCAKAFNKDRKNVVAGLCKYILRNDKLAKKVFDIKNGNKKMFTVFLALEGLATFALTKMCSDLGSKFKHRND